MNIETPFGFINTAHGIDLSISPEFQGEDLSLFGAPQPQRTPLCFGSTELSVASGSAVNCDTIQLTPHCHGTHTESAGHITTESLPIGSILPPSLLSAYLLTVSPVSASACTEVVPQQVEPTDRIIMATELTRLPPEHYDCLLIRTHGYTVNDDLNDAPYFSLDAMSCIVASGFDHLLVDLPSLDRSDDGGALANHRSFWGMAAGDTGLPSDTFRHKTITELINIPESLHDGLYLLSLQAPAWKTDAVPSRPILYSIGE